MALDKHTADKFMIWPTFHTRATVCILHHYCRHVNLLGDWGRLLQLPYAAHE